MFNRRATFFYQMKDQFLTYFSWQFFHAKTIADWLKAPQHWIQIFANLIVVFLGLKGIFYQLKKNKLSFYYFLAFFFMASVAMVFVMNLSDQEVRDRDYFFVTAYNFWTFWMALGSIALVWEARKFKKWLSYLMVFFVLFLPAVNLASQYFVHDNSRNFIALDYSLNLLNGLEENAIIFTNGDNDTFPLWYAQAVADPYVVEHSYPPTDVYPIEKTEKLIASAMEYKNKNIKGIRKDVTVIVKSLLQTPWYLRQLRDKEGIEFNLSERDISGFLERRDSPLYPKYVQKDTPVKIYGTKLYQTLQPTIPANTTLTTIDLAMLQILKDNYGKRPIYFAITAENSLGLERYLQLEGLVYRLTHPANELRINVARTIENIENVYTYRTILNENIYLSEEQRNIKHQHGHPNLMLHQYFYSKNDLGKSIQYFEEALPFLREPELFYPPLSDLYIHGAAFLAQYNFMEEAFLHLENALIYYPQNEKLADAIYQIGTFSLHYDESIALLEQLLEYQDEKQIQQKIEDLTIIKNEQKDDK
jgi:hypothetical protein